MTKIGYYSQIAKNAGKPIVVYLNEKGDEVVVTSIYESDERMEELYKPYWPDTVRVGKLTSFVREQ